MSLAMHSCTLWPSGGMDWEVLEGILHGLTTQEIAEYVAASTLAMDTKRPVNLALSSHHQTPAASMPRGSHNAGGAGASSRLTSNRHSQPDFLWRFPLGSEESSPGREHDSRPQPRNAVASSGLATLPPQAVSSTSYLAVSADSAMTASPTPGGAEMLVGSGDPTTGTTSRPTGEATYDEDEMLSEASRLPSAGQQEDELLAAVLGGRHRLEQSSSGNDETPTHSHVTKPMLRERDLERDASPPPAATAPGATAAARHHGHHHGHSGSNSRHHANAPTPPQTPPVRLPPRAPTSAEHLALIEYVREQQQLYSLLEKQYLPSPYLFVSSTALQMPLRDRVRLVEMHYELNEGLAELWFGDRLSRIDVEDDDLIEVGHPGLLEASVKRQWRNLKRVCKFITSAYRGRDGAYIPRDVPLPQAIEDVFVLPTETSRIYTALVFGFEHRLDCASLEPLEVHELASLCSAVAACWCDGSELLLSEPYVKACAALGKVLSDSRVMAELESLILGEDADGPPQRLLRQIKDTFDEMQKAMSPSTSNNSNHHHNVVTQLAVVSSTATLDASLDRKSGEGTPAPLSEQAAGAPPSSSSSSSGPMSQGNDAVMSSTSAVATVSSSNTYARDSSVIIDVPPTVVAQQPRHCSPPPPAANASSHATSSPPSRHQKYSRRVVAEFKSILRNIARISTQFGTSEKLRDVFDRFHTKVYLPLLQLGRVDAGVTVAAAQQHYQQFPPAAEVNSQQPTNSSMFFSASADAPSVSAGGGGGALSYSNSGGTQTTTVLASSDPVAAELLLATINGSIASFPTAQQYSAAMASLHMNTSGNNFSNTLMNNIATGGADALNTTTISSSSIGQSSPPPVGGAIGGGGPQGAHASSDEVLLRAVETHRYIRELSVLLADLSAAFSKLKFVSDKTHSELDDCAVHFFAVLRLYTQLLLAHDG